ncbi:MAG: signal peptidase I [Cyclobacteriaceae bacterium]|nr:signal peptidase I [Cyclobacteriaceae bacterium]
MKAFVPILGPITRIKTVGRPAHWIIYFFIPIINVFCWYYVLFDLLKSFGKTRFYHMILGVVVPFVYLPYLGISENEKYLGKASELPKIVKSKRREWADAIAFAVIAATLIRWSVMEAFTIPTPSMEKSLLVGDFLFVSKFHYGTRTPKTILQFPLTHQTIPGTKLKSYVDWIQLPHYRLPGLVDIKRNDVVVFNIPPSELNEGIDRPVDLKTNYIKRCVAISGDIIEVKNKEVIINGETSTFPAQMQTSYTVEVTSQLRDRVLNNYDISGFSVYGRKGNNFLYRMDLTKEQAAQLKGLDFVVAVDMENRSEGEGEYDIYSGMDWNADWFGPLQVPKKGMEIEITEETLKRYGEMIKNYEFLRDVTIEDNKLLIDGQEVKTYTFKQNYYFMMGDNRHNSLDSRYWGFVPEDHIVGKAFFIWLSLDKNRSFFEGKVRWDRFFKLIE